ncbi:MAG: hypothetical protein Q7S26_03650 [bacterium]|nr:hypothetical protein [bacterium]
MNNARTPLFLMANLGSEVSRVLSCRDKGQKVETQQAYERAQRIVAQIKEFPEMKSRLMEIEILSQVLGELQKEHSTLAISSQHLREYFQPFAQRLLLAGAGI